jgi:hypothetical protein
MMPWFAFTMGSAMSSFFSAPGWHNDAALNTATTKFNILSNYFDLHHWMNLPSRRAPRMMKAVFAEPLDR